MDPTKTRLWHAKNLGLAVPEPTDSGGAARAAPAERPASSRQATRIMPIERLLPGALAVRPPPPRAREPRRWLRFAGPALAGLLTLLAVAAWKLPLRMQRRAPLSPPEPVSAVADASSARTPPVPAAAPELGVERALPAGVGHEAVDLVIAGDYRRAQQAYQALARDYPNVRAFREAARILAARRAD